MLKNTNQAPQKKRAESANLWRKWPVQGYASTAVRSAV